ncbi:odorant receptor 94a-like [Episyrphus balteatus]|uniref:odorant receptor 94a-like n=1 Tax=Episyrphus balteatus TaxID=286459 RepID=UPI00248570C8|nr:odorant receptor 94a-like [Episyrphus balteatus]
MELDILQPIRLSIGILKLFGLWRLDNKYNSFYRIYTYFLHFITTFLTTTLMWTSVFKAKNFEEFTEPLYMALTMFGLSVKVINILNLNKLVVNFLKQLEDDQHFRVKNPEELKILKKSLRILYGVVVFYTSAAFAIIVFGFSVAAYGKERVLVYPAWMPFDYQCNSKNYMLAYFHQLVGMVVACLANTSLDMLQCYLLHSVSLIYLIVGHRLTALGKDLNNFSNNFEVNKIILDDLRDIIKVHNLAKKLTVDCERFLSKPIFTQILLSAFVLCFTGYRLTFMSFRDNPGRFIIMMDYLFVISLQIYLPCHYGNQVTIEAGKLSAALYTSNWTYFPMKSKKIICLYMELLKEPISVKAGGFFQIGIPTFGKTLNNAYSFFAVLIRMKS